MNFENGRGTCYMSTGKIPPFAELTWCIPFKNVQL